ncbi:DUF3592 domain-containing protein [Reichenbachiella sp. MALMAid0571]|uniref:DUF3592 domain-containing protein n=1 Tax=Reichenbachiella sp. MALMAid0571 TaxID=3143939 RepID=UPI0032E00BF1
MKEKRHINNHEYCLLYFKTAPYLIGEFFTIGGIIGIGMLIKTQDVQALVSLIFLGIGVFFIRRKIITLKVGTQVIKYGEKTIARITRVSNTNSEHNGRVVKEYHFQYEVDNCPLNYSFKSAYHRQLERGDELSIFYMPNDPKTALIPSLYSIHKY